MPVAPEFPLLVVTTTFFAPAVPLGVTQVMVVEFVKLGLVQVFPPTVAVIPDIKFVPVMVMVVPPVSLPTAGETEVTVGAGGFTAMVRLNEFGPAPSVMVIA